MATTPVATFSSSRLDPLLRSEVPERLSVKLIASTTFVKGTVLGQVTATPGTYKAYASGNSDGSQVPTGILQYGCTTDASGNITIDGEWSATYLSAAMYINGTFKTDDLTGLDTNAVTKLGGLMVEGTTTSGIFRF